MVFSFLKKKETILGSRQSIQPLVLISLDGWGIAHSSQGNPIAQAKTPNMVMFQSRYPHGQLLASGESVGLPANEVGNSEVGHLTMGVGRVILQSLKRINKSIEDGSFYENQAFLNAVRHIQKYKSKLHILGLVSHGSVHSSLGHFYALLELCRKQGLSSEVYYHLFLDGRDASPTAGGQVVTDIQERIAHLKIGKIATISGRYYAMDRDARWERTQKTYNALTLGQGLYAENAYQVVKDNYAKGITDEFIVPTIITQNGKPLGTVDNNDAMIFFNFRVDRARQLTMAFCLPEFEKLKGFTLEEEPFHGRNKSEKKVIKSTFKRQMWPHNLYFVTMTEYQKNVYVSDIAFPPQRSLTSVTSVLSKANFKQLHLTESEKERMVTIYFDGFHEGGYPNEDIVILPSPHVATYDKRPQMALFDVIAEFKRRISLNTYKFIIMNFANPDMVAHSGNLKATIKAIEYVDKALGEVYKEVMNWNGTLVITADHGNAEELITYPKGAFFFTTSEGDINTDHSNNPIPFMIINKVYEGKPLNLPTGTLSDVAPTILSLMNIPVPSEMTGRNLLSPISNTTLPKEKTLPAELPWLKPEI